ncbi:aminotransferase class I and II family protein [Candidatus Endolissoclinum faulkneri L2]|uniref:Aminotransferase class I and II family protein n=2 Tax=Candidatus Endolissoclinum faulkneri TaxID=1263979 RepID=K7YN70_9PROT|nr:aminotransferase class I and II family protein [Candidatus Endolissoclinum faulkneri L2]
MSSKIHTYPTESTSGLVEAIGVRYGINDPSRIVLGCGSDELIRMLTQAYLEPGDEAIHTQYGFLQFPIATKIAGGVPVSAPDNHYTASVDAILECISSRTKIVFLANPNNPTGTYLSNNELRRLRVELPSRVLLVLDAAYAEYVQMHDYTAGIDLVEQTDNTVMLRTFSKMYAMAGLRLGWAYCSDDIAATLYAVKPPYSVNALSLPAGVAAVNDLKFQKKSLSHNAIWLPWLQNEFKKLGMKPYSSVTNFFIIRLPKQAREYLVKRGIIVRSMSDYGKKEFIRISVGLEDDNRAVIAAMVDFFNQIEVRTQDLSL